MIIDPRIGFLGYQHQWYTRTVDWQSGNELYKMHYPKPKWELILLHSADHWRGLEYKQESIMDFKNINHLSLFFEITNAQCQIQNIIDYWIDQWLNDKIYGEKWKNKLKVEPLLDQNGIFCYLKQDNYTRHWHDGK